jgi:hypothetical protein
MKKKIITVAVLAGGLSITGTSIAADFQAQMNACLERHANTRDKANVLLECEAQNGKLVNCKAIENNASKGFEKAAICIAESMPMAGKTGAIRVPFRFPGDG